MELRNGLVIGSQFVLPAEVRPAFEEGAALVFQTWTALSLAVDQQWGGSASRSKAQALLEDVIAWFYRHKEHYVDELEEDLDDALEQDFNIQAEDDSPRQVATLLVRLYQELCRGVSTQLESLRQAAAAAAASGAQASRRQVVDRDGTAMDDSSGSSSDEDSDGGDATMDDAPAAPAAPVIDEDGFQLVTRRGRR